MLITIRYKDIENEFCADFEERFANQIKVKSERSLAGGYEIIVQILSIALSSTVIATIIKELFKRRESQKKPFRGTIKIDENGKMVLNMDFDIETQEELLDFVEQVKWVSEDHEE